MTRKNYELIGGLLLICALLLWMPNPVSAAMFGHAAFSDVDDALRDADRARDKYLEHKKDRDAGRYEREWVGREQKLEQIRIERIAREAKISAHEVRKMRENGRNWREISEHCRIDAQKMGHGHQGPRGYDRDNDRDLYRQLYKR